MSTLELKSDLYKILDKIDNEELLRTIYDFLKQPDDSKSFWSSLTEAQRQEVYLSYQESENDANLISWDDLKKKY
ncbi:MAG: hypothetical protein J0L67_18900 [Cytophagales bacterium]|jgi:hypothetical protein|nr:hypothetical protein [Cytophagales bacterium]